MTGEPVIHGTAPSGTASLLAAAVLERPDRQALWVNGLPSTYGQLARRIADYQAFARGHGLTATDRVVFDGPPGLDFYAVLLAGVFGSFTVSFLSRSLPAATRARLVGALDPTLLIGDLPGEPVEGRHRIAPAGIAAAPLADVDVHDVPSTHLSLTSGTLGTPTAALVDSVGMAGFLAWARAELDTWRDDRWFEGADPTSDLGLTNALMAFSAGASFGLASGPWRMRVASVAADYGTTVMRAVPAVATMLLREASSHQVRLKSLRLLAFGGDALPGTLPRRLLRAVGSSARTLNTYGKTEIAGFGLFAWFDPEREHRDNAGGTIRLGGPVPGTAIRVDTTGELVVTSPGVALTLTRYTDPVSVVATKASTGETATLRTGDLVERIGDELRFAGRADRVVKVNGVRVSLAQLESSIGGVFGATVCTLTHDGVIAALVESRHDLSAADVARPLRDKVPAFLLPAEIVTVPRLPRNRTGKIDIGRCELIMSERFGRE